MSLINKLRLKISAVSLLEVRGSFVEYAVILVLGESFLLAKVAAALTRERSDLLVRSFGVHGHPVVTNCLKITKKIKKKFRTSSTSQHNNLPVHHIPALCMCKADDGSSYVSSNFSHQKTLSRIEHKDTSS